MEFSEYILSKAEKALQIDRINNKLNENKDKPSITSPDIVYTKDYIFSHNHGIKNIGDSGKLLLSRNKKNPNEKYIVKHEFTDCACNEFVYSKLAEAMNIKIPKTKLFILSEDEKRKYFLTEYIIGIEYLDIIKAGKFSLEYMKESQILNIQDFFKFFALYAMFNESDGFEIVQAKDNYLYKIDNTSSFIISNYYIDYLGIDKDYNGNRITVLIFEQLMNILKRNNPHKEALRIQFQFDNIIKSYGKEYVPYFLEPLYDIQEIKDDFIDIFLNTLCYIYPDCLADYYKQYINIVKVKSREFLKTLTFN